MLRRFGLYLRIVTALADMGLRRNQCWAVNATVESTVRATGLGGDQCGGVVWHTQGSGKW